VSVDVDVEVAVEVDVEVSEWSLVRVLVLVYEVLEDVESIPAVVFKNAREQAAEVDALVPIDALENE
jgi:hypothetical protein